MIRLIPTEDRKPDHDQTGDALPPARSALLVTKTAVRAPRLQPDCELNGPTTQLVHHFTDEQNRDLMRRIASALKPGGVCVLLDTLRPSSPEGAGGIGAVLDLYFAATSRSGTWPLETMQTWQRDAGLTVGKPLHLRTLPGAAMVLGRKSSR